VNLNNHRTSAWLAFWDTSNSIFVNAHHKDVHYRQMAEAISQYLPSPSARVLDYGSGEALHADIVAAAAGEVLLCEGAPQLRAGVAARFADIPKIRAVAPEEVERLQQHSLDLIVMHSVVQYLTPDDTQALFALFGRLLKRSGMLIVSDVISPNVSAITDVLALLRFGAANGFLIPTFGALLRIRFSDYWLLRTRFGPTQYREAAMIEKLTASGFLARRANKNFGHNQARMAFVAWPRSSSIPDDPLS
jgi:SAM-dependent methyltransferase